jgi:hypothetical protein
MYSVDVSQLIRRATLGSRVDDPTLPVRPSRLARLWAYGRPQPAIVTTVPLTSPRHGEAPAESCSDASAQKAA